MDRLDRVIEKLNSTVAEAQKTMEKAYARKEQFRGHVEYEDHFDGASETALEAECVYRNYKYMRDWILQAAE